MAKETPPIQIEQKKVNRREFLNFAWLASLGFLTLNMAGLTYLFAMPRFKEGEFGGVVTIGHGQLTCRKLRRGARKSAQG